MIDEKEWVKHARPAWGERSNYIANFDLDVSQLPLKWEQLWLRRVSEHRFEVCCIPFFAYGLHLGDVVTLSHSGVVETIATPSGHWTLRLFFSAGSSRHDEVLEQLEAMGVEHEQCSKSLYSLDTTGPEHVRNVMAFLDDHVKDGHLDYETGWM
jgi:hypothetical protein